MLTTIEIKSDKLEDHYCITYHLINELGDALFSFSSGSEDFSLHKGMNNITCTIPKYFFQSGTFMLSLFIVQNKKNPIFIEKDIMTFTVVDGERELGVYLGREPGFIRPTFKWKLL